MEEEQTCVAEGPRGGSRTPEAPATLDFKSQLVLFYQQVEICCVAGSENENKKIPLAAKDELTLVGVKCTLRHFPPPAGTFTSDDTTPTGSGTDCGL